ncbi:MAG: hypothetical protein F7B17_07875 [Desulfurococcales archaeon]|nr:hypothetical protein [Desulfurococcales archaeon]
MGGLYRRGVSGVYGALIAIMITISILGVAYASFDRLSWRISESASIAGKMISEASSPTVIMPSVSNGALVVSFESPGAPVREVLAFYRGGGLAGKAAVNPPATRGSVTVIEGYGCEPVLVIAVTESGALKYYRSPSGSPYFTCNVETQSLQPQSPVSDVYLKPSSVGVASYQIMEAPAPSLVFNGNIENAASHTDSDLYLDLGPTCRLVRSSGANATTLIGEFSRGYREVIVERVQVDYGSGVLTLGIGYFIDCNLNVFGLIVKPLDAPAGIAMIAEATISLEAYIPYQGRNYTYMGVTLIVEEILNASGNKVVHQISGATIGQRWIEYSYTAQAITARGRLGIALNTGNLNERLVITGLQLSITALSVYQVAPISLQLPMVPPLAIYMTPVEDTRLSSVYSLWQCPPKAYVEATIGGVKVVRALEPGSTVTLSHPDYRQSQVTLRVEPCLTMPFTARLSVPQGSGPIGVEPWGPTLTGSPIPATFIVSDASGNRIMILVPAPGAQQVSSGSSSSAALVYIIPELGLTSPQGLQPIAEIPLDENSYPELITQPQIGSNTRLTLLLYRDGIVYWGVLAVWE